MAALDLSFEHEKTRITARGDIVRGWQSAVDGYGFFGLGRIDYRGVQMQVSLQVRARPNRLAHLVAQFPPDLSLEGGDEGRAYRVHGSNLEVCVDIPRHVVWLRDAEKWGLNWRPDTPIVTLGRVRMYLRFLASFTPDRSRPGIIWERDLLPFLAGGQFESNRSRH